MAKYLSAYFLAQRLAGYLEKDASKQDFYIRKPTAWRHNTFSAHHSARLGLPRLSSSTYGICELLEGLDGRIPVNAGIGDTDAFLKRAKALCRILLVAFIDVGLDHDTDDLVLALAKLVANGLSDFGLVLVVLLRVAYTAVSQRTRGESKYEIPYRASSQSS